MTLSNYQSYMISKFVFTVIETDMPYWDLIPTKYKQISNFSHKQKKFNEFLITKYLTKFRFIKQHFTHGF